MDGLAAGPDGYADLLGDADPAGRGPGQRLMGTRLLPEIYERLWRPVLGVLGPGAGAERRLVRELLELGPGVRVLDAGCGPGNFTRDFAAAVGDGRVVGVDALVRPLTGVRLFGREELTGALRARGLRDVRRRVDGFGQFVSARRG